MANPKAQSELDEVYGRTARRYDLLNRVMTFGLDRRVRRTASALVKPGLILDMGTGTGVSSRELRRAHPGSTIIGIDRSPEMLGFASAKGAGLYVRADVRVLPFRDRVFDGIAAGFVFRPIDGDGAAIEEGYRVLKPGGRAVIYDVLRVPPGVFGVFYRLALAVYIPLCAFILADDLSAYLYFTRSIRESVTADELAARFRNAGFSAVVVKSMIFATVTVLTVDKPADA
ncbi:MAG: class I SAM-dependent methyltransferase [Candidatus Coatesbacteria bacterium]|nr:MAG: class I SAM-dependent methyltransferase [Candidatus Coatesbacteria bacterium]